MRGLLLAILFFSATLTIPKRPWNGILTWFWISLMQPQEVAYGALASIPYALVTAIVTILAWLASNEPKSPPGHRTTVLLILLGVWVSITSLFAIGPAADVYMWWSNTEKMLLMTVIAYTITTTRQRLEQLVLICTLSVCFYGLKGGAWVLLTGGANRVYGPAGTMIGDNNDLGVALVTFLPLLFFLWQRYRQPYFKWPLLAWIVLTFVAALFTYSRGALVAMGVMGAMLLMRSRRKMTVAVLMAATALGVYNFAPASLFERWSTIDSYQADGSAEGRLYTWALSWQMALHRPIIGAGLHWSYAPSAVNRELSSVLVSVPEGQREQITVNDRLPELTRPRASHSIWFEMLSDHGFPGLFLFIAFLISAAVDARWLVREARERPELAWADNLGRMITASLVGYAVGGTFASLSLYDGFYALVIVASAARRIVAHELAEEKAPKSAVARVAFRRPNPSIFGSAP